MDYLIFKTAVAFANLGVGIWAFFTARHAWKNGSKGLAVFNYIMSTLNIFFFLAFVVNAWLVGTL